MGHGSDVGTELGADHRLIELLCRRLPTLRDAGSRRADLARIAEILARHESFERRYLAARLSEWMPGPRDGRPRGSGPSGSSETAARPAERAQSGDPGEPGESADQLVARARLHIRYEEERMLPALEALADWRELEYLGEQVRAEREAEATGRPQ